MLGAEMRCSQGVSGSVEPCGQFFWDMVRWNCCWSVAKLCPTLKPHGLQHARLPYPSLSPRVCSDSRPLIRWCHPTISSCVIPFSSCLWSFPASGSSPMSQLFTSGGQSFGASALASVLPVNIQGWFPLELTGLISLLSKGISRVGAAYGNLDMYEQCHPTTAEAWVGPKDNTQHVARAVLTVSSALKQTRSRSPAPLPVPAACLPSSMNASPPPSHLGPVDPYTEEGF